MKTLLCVLVFLAVPKLMLGSILSKPWCFKINQLWQPDLAFSQQSTEDAQQQAQLSQQSSMQSTEDGQQQAQVWQQSSKQSTEDAQPQVWQQSSKKSTEDAQQQAQVWQQFSKQFTEDAQQQTQVWQQSSKKSTEDAQQQTQVWQQSSKQSTEDAQQQAQVWQQSSKQSTEDAQPQVWQQSSKKSTEDAQQQAQVWQQFSKQFTEDAQQQTQVWQQSSKKSTEDAQQQTQVWQQSSKKSTEDAQQQAQVSQQREQTTERVPKELKSKDYQEQKNENSKESLAYLLKKQREPDSSSGSAIEHSNTKRSNTQETKEIIRRKFVVTKAKKEAQKIKLTLTLPSDLNGGDIFTGKQNMSVESKINATIISTKAYATLYPVRGERKKRSHEKYEVIARTDNEDVYLNATQLLKKNNYFVEEHSVKTEDGYYLTLFRIPPQQKCLCIPNRPVVFLMHGLLGSADDWLLMGPQKSLAYILANFGYDVWLGNTRGNKYSRHHVSKLSSQDDFWQFSIDEIALKDLPAMIDFALTTSKKQKMHYIGHSQGATAFFALAASRPVYNDKIIMMHALSPMVYMSSVRSPLFRMNSQYQLNQLSNGEFKPNKELIRAIGGDMCQKIFGLEEMCSNIYFVVSGVNLENLNTNFISIIMGHLPAGASARQMKHFAQTADSNEFTSYDFGSEMNQAVYGSAQPPRYNMQEVSALVSLYYSEDDWLSHPEDVHRLQKELPNVKDVYRVPRENHFSSMDFQFSERAPQLVYQNIISTIQEDELTM